MKKQLYTTLGALIISITFSTHAQNYDDYSLKSYKTPDIKRALLDFKFNSNGSFNVSSDNSDKKTFQLDGVLESNFNRYVNTRKLISEQQAYIGVTGNKTNDNENSNTKRTMQFNSSFQNSCKHYSLNNFFWSTGGNIDFSYYNTKTSSEDSSYRNLYLSISPMLGIGIGRIEPVQDARQAVYILDDLSKKGILTTKLSNEEINRFSQVISSVKNKRFLDSRLHLIDEISCVDSFLVNNNYLKKSGAGYFTTIYDDWLYGDLFQRGSGFEISSQVKPLYIHSKASYDEKSTNWAGISALISVKYEEPINLYWQQSANLLAEYDYSAIIDSRDGGGDLDQRSGQLLGSYKIGYYPNSRTNLNFGISENLKFTRFGTPETYYSSITNFDLSAYYYLSPQLRLAGNIDLNYNKTDNSGVLDQLNYKWHGSYYLTLTYSLF